MSSGPENRYLASINRLLPETIHREKMHNPYRGGTFDMWYSGKMADIWVEYKWVPKIPKKGLTPDLSELQKKWGRGRTEEGRRVYVIVGTPEGGVVFNAPNEWEAGFADVSNQLRTKNEVANTIAALTTGEGIGSDSKNPGRRRQRKRISISNSDRRVSHIRTGEVPNEQAAGKRRSTDDE